MSTMEPDMQATVMAFSRAVIHGPDSLYPDRARFVSADAGKDALITKIRRAVEDDEALIVVGAGGVEHMIRVHKPRSPFARLADRVRGRVRIELMGRTLPAHVGAVVEPARQVIVHPRHTAEFDELAGCFA